MQATNPPCDAAMLVVISECKSILAAQLVRVVSRNLAILREDVQVAPTLLERYLFQVPFRAAHYY